MQVDQLQYAGFLTPSQRQPQRLALQKDISAYTAAGGKITVIATPSSSEHIYKPCRVLGQEIHYEEH